MVIEGACLVEADTPYCEVADFDQPGLRLAVGKGAGDDLFLTRTLKSAQLERAETSGATVDLHSDTRVALGRWCMLYTLETPRADLRFT